MSPEYFNFIVDCCRFINLRDKPLTFKIVCSKAFYSTDQTASILCRNSAFCSIKVGQHNKALARMVQCSLCRVLARTYLESRARPLLLDSLPSYERVAENGRLCGWQSGRQIAPNQLLPGSQLPATPFAIFTRVNCIFSVRKLM